MRSNSVEIAPRVRKLQQFSDIFSASARTSYLTQLPDSNYTGSTPLQYNSQLSCTRFQLAFFKILKGLSQICLQYFVHQSLPTAWITGVKSCRINAKAPVYRQQRTRFMRVHWSTSYAPSRSMVRVAELVLRRTT